VVAVVAQAVWNMARRMCPDRRRAAIAIGAGLPLLAAARPHSLVALADIFYRSGALVFGGGPVVLPLLRDALVPHKPSPGRCSHSRRISVR
jgi:chromate transport protein ChrA